METCPGLVKILSPTREGPGGEARGEQVGRVCRRAALPRRLGTLLLPLLLSAALAVGGASAAAAQPVPGEEVPRISGQVLAIDANGASATIDLNAMQVSPGLHAQVVRQGADGWLEVARGRITAVTPGGSHLTIERRSAGIAPIVQGDAVIVYLVPPPWALVRPAGPGSGVQAEPLPVATAPAAHPAARAPASPEDAGERVALSLGLAGGFVATLRAAPADAPSTEAGMWGPGGGMGLLIEGRFWRYLGLELGLVYDVLQLSKETTVAEEYTGEPQRVSTSYRPRLRSTVLRVPLLVKVVVPAGPLRFSLGAGPELALGLQTTADIEVATPGYRLTGAAADELAARTATLRQQLKGEAVNQVFFTSALGLAIRAGRLSIPLELRAGYDPTERDNFVNYWTLGAGGTQQGDHTLDLRVFIGLCYDIDVL